MKSVFEFSFGKPKLKLLFKSPLTFIARYLSYVKLRRKIKNLKTPEEKAEFTSMFTSLVRPGPLADTQAIYTRRAQGEEV